MLDCLLKLTGLKSLIPLSLRVAHSTEYAGAFAQRCSTKAFTLRASAMCSFAINSAVRRAVSTTCANKASEPSDSAMNLSALSGMIERCALRPSSPVREAGRLALQPPFQAQKNPGANICAALVLQGAPLFRRPCISSSPSAQSA